MVDARRHFINAVTKQQKIDGAAARNDIQLAADGLFHSLCTLSQEREVFPSGQHAVQTGVVGANTPQAQVGQTFTKRCQLHQLGNVVHTFPQIAHIQHQNDAGMSAPLPCFFIQKPKHVGIGMKAQISILCGGLQIAAGRATGQEGLFLRKSFFDCLQMFSTGNSQLCAAAVGVSLCHLQITIREFDNACYRNVIFAAQVTQNLRVLTHSVQIDRQCGIMLHDLHHSISLSASSARA